MIDPKVASRSVRLLAGHGPAVSKARSRSFVAGLRRVSRRAPLIVADQTHWREHLPAVKDIPVSVLARPAWAELAARSAGVLMDGAVKESAIRRRVVSEEVGLALSFAAPRILGQYDPFSGDQGRLALVAPNMWAFTKQWNLDARDLQLFVSIHEYCHAFQFTAAPWLADMMKRCVAEALHGQGDALDTMMALMSVLEGQAEYVMNHVPVTIIPSIHRIRAAMASRRHDTSALSRIIGKILGHDEKIAQYQAGEEFISALIRHGGPRVVHELFSSEATLPTLSEISEPDQWITRVLS